VTQHDLLNLVASQQDANRYVYAGGNPINSIDPAGLCLVDALCDAADRVARGGSRVVHGVSHAARTVARGAWVAARNRYVRYGAMTIAVGAGEIACGPACAVGVGTALYVADNADEPR
jgi:hypothetical protein